ncbi:MAG: hypothetical protein GY862_36785 [Gammaproteobacteria bacterium]|nr:hypothetical protein [Gammaproteobacteria bacterium]
MPEQQAIYVLDASVLINLLGSGSPDQLLECLPGRCIMAEQAFHEVKTDPGTRLPCRTDTERLVASSDFG